MKRTLRSNLLPLGELLSVSFRVAHACPKQKKVCYLGDWTKFKLVEDDGDLFVFECTGCKQAVCIEVGAEIARKKR